MRRTKEEAAVTRATVLKAALTVFSAKGYAAASLDDVAKTAKVTRGAIYWHFKSKADLYNTLVEELSARGAHVGVLRDRAHWHVLSADLRARLRRDGAGGAGRDQDV